MRKLAIALVGAVLLAAAPVAAASAPPPLGSPATRSFIGGSGSFTLTGYCSFPVGISYTSNEYAIHTSTSTGPLGTTLYYQITGNYFATATNAQTGKAITYQANGPFTEVFYPDGSFSIDATGPNLLWTTPADSYPGVPYIAYTHGAVHVFVEASGLTITYSHSGNTTDVCSALAG
jgi:hypothetical protein